MQGKKYCQMGQVCKITGLPHSTIRFWEKSFPILQPVRSSGGHRYYSMEQVELLQYLKKLLHEEGYTIDGAKKRLAAEKIHHKAERETAVIEEEIPAEIFPDNETVPNNLRKEMKDGLEQILYILKDKEK